MDIDQARSLKEKAHEFGTDRQIEILDALLVHGTITKAAKAAGLSRGTLHSSLVALKRKATRGGWSPCHDMTRTVPDGFHVGGVSTLYNADGEVSAQWVKSRKDSTDKHADLLESITGLTDDMRGRSKKAKKPKRLNDDLLAVYPMGDPHLGMFAWAQEAGDDFDLDIAERELFGAIDRLVDLAPPARHALLINLGDFFHANSPANRTTLSGNPLDVDTRWARVLRIGIRLFRRMIDRALMKHEFVTVICEIGNHDDTSSLFLATVLAAYYENNKRVTVDESPMPFHWYRFGNNMLGTTHGQNVKLAALPGIMAVDKRADWGETEHHEWYVGHVHHDQRKEYPGCSVETYRTLAPKDAWHAAKGYRSERDMKLDIWHRKHGKIARHIVGISRIFADD